MSDRRRRPTPRDDFGAGRQPHSAKAEDQFVAEAQTALYPQSSLRRATGDRLPTDSPDLSQRGSTDPLVLKFRGWF
jgi:hypothetical protein